FGGGSVRGELAPAVNRLQELQETGSILFLSILACSVFIGGGIGLLKLHPLLRAREFVEKIVSIFLVGSSLVAILTTIGIVGALLFESIRFFQLVPLSEFLFGAKWSPQMAIRADQVASSGAFGVIPLVVGTVMISAIAMAVATPIGIFSAVYFAEYASPRFRFFAKPVLEILAGIPTVVYGFFAALTVAPAIRDIAEFLGVKASSECALAAGIVMGIMIIPFISSLTDDVINSIPQSLRDGSYALGATKSETVKRVILPAALPGIVGAVLLGVSRAVGETMIVVMAAGIAANLTLNPLESLTTVTVQIVTILVGDQEFESAKTLSAFALGLTLFVVTLILNVVALQVVKRYRELYD
ncbi:MAG: phosphate ABC transporter permease subunit PstC, partial [Bdellovibrionales bacterium]|nr:phosphate ABC transporter permease subunit PstC [Bdellovibrionales bacterium]